MLPSQHKWKQNKCKFNKMNKTKTEHKYIFNHKKWQKNYKITKS